MQSFFSFGKTKFQYKLRINTKDIPIKSSWFHDTNKRQNAGMWSQGENMKLITQS
jgi:hypothetical protein